ncbi:gamma-glutamyltransferase [Candidatus Poribacteria bacterium]|nr:gamma-glutamyltransferase [Candidatus Poribacteria bacterium]
MTGSKEYRAMVSTAHPIATETGINVLRQGGNCVDAAIAVAAVLNVVDMGSTGVGGDAFALVFFRKEGKVVGLNASGRAPFEATIEAYKARGLSFMPESGPLSITTPGALSGWVMLHERYGTMPFGDLLKPAIKLAKEGFEVSPAISLFISLRAETIRQFRETAEVYLKPSGEPPKPGERLYQENLGRSLESIATNGASALYGGALGSTIADSVRRAGGFLSRKDFVERPANWVEPIHISYRGYDVFTIPPNSQGIALLEMLNIMEGYDAQKFRENAADLIHLQVEAKKLAFIDRDRFISDPDFHPAPVADLLSKRYAVMQRAHINPVRAATASANDRTPSGDTTYFCAVDVEGNAVSFINSLFHPFGSGMVAGDTGILLQNRGNSFSLDPGHVNSLRPHKRPMHTLVPCMVMKSSNPYLALGCIGGDQQPQGLLQILLNILDFGMSPQEAINAPRWRSYDAGKLALESTIGANVVHDLSARGHILLDEADFFGGSQCIMFEEDGSLVGGSDPRLAGCWQGLP